MSVSSSASQADATSSAAATAGLRREFGSISLLFTSVGSVIGSGWLLGALTATTIAGPAAIIAWVVAAFAMMLIALINAELGGMHHVQGGIARFPRYAFGTLVGFGTGWIYWLGSVTLAPIETEAALQYGDHWIDKWFGFHLVTQHSASVFTLTGPGYAAAAILMLAFTVINLAGARRLSHSNSAVVAWKIAVPGIAIVALMVTQFKGSNFSAGNGFAPAGLKGILTAISTGGVIFAYTGFEQAIQFGGESKRPGRDIPVAVIGAMLLGAVVYILLELAFMGALNPQYAVHGWANLTFKNQYGPYAGLADTLGLAWLAFILYIDAFLSPAGTGLIYTGSSSRINYTLGRDGYIPKGFGRLDSRGTPWVSVIFACIVGMIVFLPFPGWQKLVGFITSASVIIYAVQCVSAAAMRRQLPDHPRPFRLPAMNVLAPIGFIIANEIVLFAGWTIVWKMLVAIGLGLLLMAASQIFRPAEERVPLDWRSSWWMWVWLAALGVISWQSSFTGGADHLHFGVDMAVTAVVALITFYAALATRLPADTARAYVEERVDVVTPAS